MVTTARPAKTDLLQNAVALHHAGNLPAAAAAYESALARRPSDPQALFGLGTLRLQQGDLTAAEALLKKSLRGAPLYPPALVNHGIALTQLNRLTDAARSFDRAVALSPNDASAHANRAALWLRLARPAEALADTDHALRTAPANADLHFQRGNALSALNLTQEAIAAFDRAVELRPAHAETHNNLGVELFRSQRALEAIESYQRALALRPDYADAWNNLGTALCDLGRVAESLAAFDRAFEFAPTNAEGLINRGNLLLAAGSPGDAQTSYARALLAQPGNLSAELNLGLSHLLRGDFERGWPLFESRWSTRAEDLRFGQIRAPDLFEAPLWLGETQIRGRVLFVHGEQGIGDIIQFCRYVGELVARGILVVLECPTALLGLFSRLPWPVVLVEKGTLPPPHDLHIPMMSLPLAMKTRVDNIPAPAPYLFADGEKSAVWRDKLGAAKAPRVGIVWSGYAGHGNDANRSVALATLAPLFELPVEFHSLQKEVRPADEDTLSAAPIARHESHLTDFDATAALIAQMDLVIAVDTSVAHLAAALGKPVWLLLPFNPDFRWMLARTDSPWYPTMRLFRQSKPGDWSEVISHVTVALRDLKR